MLVPNDRALERVDLHDKDASIAERRHALVHSIHDHCFSGHYRFEVGQRIVSTSQGEIGEAARAGSRRVGEVGKILSGPIESNGLVIYVTDFVAARRHRPRGAPAPRSATSTPRQQSGSFVVRPELLLFHPSLVDRSDRSEAAPNVRLGAIGGGNSADRKGLAEIIANLVKDYVPDSPQTGQANRLQGAAQSASRWKARSGMVLRNTLVVRGSVRAMRQFSAVFGRTNDAASAAVQARKGTVRGLLLANRIAARWKARGRKVLGKLPMVRGSVRAMRKFSTVLGRTNDATSAGVHGRKGTVHALLLANHMEQADVAAGGVVQLWRELGGDLVAQGHIELGLHCRRRAFALNPDDLQLRQELVRELLLAGRYEEANAAAGGELQLWRRLAGELVVQGYPELGLYCRRSAAETDAGNIQLRKELVRELLLANDKEAANREAAGQKQLWRELGDELSFQGHLDLAQYSRGQALEAKAAEVTDPSIKFFTDVKVEIGLLGLRELLSAYSEALGAPDGASSESSPGPLAYLDKYLAGSKASLDPLTDLSRLLEREPEFAEAWLEKAFCHWEKGELVPAVEAALRAARAKPRCLRAGYNPRPHAEAAELIARCLEMAGLFEQAINAYRKSLSFDEDRTFLRVCLGQLLWRQGLVDEAMNEFMKGMTFSYRLANLPDLPRRLDRLSLEFNLSGRP